MARSNTTITVEQHSPPQPSYIPAPDSPESPIYKHPSPEEAQILSQYTVIRFSTGQVLEDDFQAVWYSLRAHELLEIHRQDVVLRLPRGIPSEYAVPYFEAPVRILTLAGPSGMYHTDDDKRRTRSPPEDEKRTKGKEKEKDRSADKDRLKKGKIKDPDAPAKLERPRSKRQKLEWKDKWLVVRAGVVYLCQDPQDTNPHKHNLSNLIALKGTDQLTDANIAPPLPHRVICAEFRIRPEPSPRHTNKPKDFDKKRSTTPTPHPTEDPSMGDASTPVSLKRSALRHSSSRDTDFASPARFPRDDVSISKSKVQKTRIVISTHPSHILSSSTSSPTDSSFLIPIDPDDARGPADDDESEYRDGLYGLYEDDSEEGQWIVLDMLEDGAYSSILRILHRQFPPPIVSSFLPDILPIVSSSPTPYYTPLPSPIVPPSNNLVSEHTLDANPLVSQSGADAQQRARLKKSLRTAPTVASGGPTLYGYGAVPYPEWRIGLVERARKAGVGEISPALGIVLLGWNEPEVSSGAFVGSDEFLRPEVLVEGEDRGVADGSAGGEGEGGSESVQERIFEVEADDVRTLMSGNSSGENSEAEWEGWMGDLGRQQEELLTGGSRGLSGCSLGTLEKSSLLEVERDGAPPAGSVAQRLTLEGRRALEPSAVVSRVRRSRSRGMAQHSPGGGLSPSTIGESTMSFSPPMSSSSVSTPTGKDRESGVSPAGQYVVDYRASLRTKMSIDEVLETAHAQQATLGMSGLPLPAPPPDTPLSPRALSTRKRSATTTAAEVVSRVDLGADRLSTSRSVSSLTQFVGKKGKGKDKDRDGGLASKKEKKAAGERDKARLPSLLSSGSRDNNEGPSTSADGAMTSSTSLTIGGRPATTESGSIRASSSSILRHVRSGSNLNEGSGLSASLTERPAGRRVGLGLVRGMSVRAGRLVRGLDAALDFVDPR